MTGFSGLHGSTLPSDPRRQTGQPAVAMVLDSLAAVAILTGGVYALFNKVVIEPDGAALNASHIGSQLLTFLGLPAGLLIVAIASGWAVRGRSAHFVAICAAALSLVLAVGAIVHAERQLHPTLAGEHAALAAFVPPAGALAVEDNIDVTATPTIERFWNVPGSLRDACAEMQAHLQSWADPGTEHSIPQPSGECSFSARKNRYRAELDGFSGISDHPVSVSLTLTQTN